MIDTQRLRALSAEERAELRRALADLDDHARLDERGLRRRLRFGLAVAAAACVFLAGWAGMLAATLPPRFEARHWNVVWTGFDVILLAALAATAWSGWRRRQIVVFHAAVAATLLLTDAWFDIMLSWGGPDLPMSLLSAALGELPLAALLLTGARRITQTSLAVTRFRSGLSIADPRLREVPLLISFPLDPSY